MQAASSSFPQSFGCSRFGCCKTKTISQTLLFKSWIPTLLPSLDFKTYKKKRDIFSHSDMKSDAAFPVASGNVGKYFLTWITSSVRITKIISIY